jgi:hypothetical protein
VDRVKKLTVVGAAAVIVLLVLFFFAPVFFWFSAGPWYQAYPHASLSETPVYRSLGCIAFGFGDVYGPDWFGLVFGCSPASFWQRNPFS